MKIYGFPLSPFVRKVMLVAHEKNLENEIVPANPMQPSEDFLAASPYGKIPAIDDDGFQLADSTAIAVYLDAKHPAPALLPADPKARARAVWFDEVADTVLMAAGGPMLFNRLIAPKVLGQEGDEAAAQAAEEAIAGRLGYLEGALGEDGWLDGDFSLGRGRRRDHVGGGVLTLPPSPLARGEDSAAYPRSGLAKPGEG